MKELKIFCPFKAADIWRRSNTRPAVEKSDKGRDVVFIFPDTDATRNALNYHQADQAIKDFIDRFRILRQEMYLVRGGSGHE